MLILWDPANQTPHHGPGPWNRHAKASRQPMPVKPGGPTPRLPKHNSPPPRESSPPAEQGALHRTRVKPSQRLSGGAQPEGGAPPGRHAVEGPLPDRRRRQCKGRPPPHDPRTRGPWMLVPPGFHRLRRSGDHTAEVAPGHRPRVHATAGEPPHSHGKPENEGDGDPDTSDGARTRALAD